jgi:glycosyltransferase involved in cell wall biosynthesis
MTTLSVVIPIYNEEAILPELVRRCRLAIDGIDAEVLLVDDHSTDGSNEFLAALPAPFRHLRLPANRGQWGATREGLSQANGRVVAVLDGDLQDPPEALRHLMNLLLRDCDTDVVFAARKGRVDPLWLRGGRQGYRLLQYAVNAGNVVPSGVGSYCVMRPEVARRAASVDLPDANLAAVLTALRVSANTYQVERSPRAAGESRVGPVGLVREALGSLWLLSPLGRRSLRDG